MTITLQTPLLTTAILLASTTVLANDEALLSEMLAIHQQRADDIQSYSYEFITRDYHRGERLIFRSSANAAKEGEIFNNALLGGSVLHSDGVTFADLLEVRTLEGDLVATRQRIYSNPDGSLRNIEPGPLVTYTTDESQISSYHSHFPPFAELGRGLFAKAECEAASLEELFFSGETTHRLEHGPWSTTVTIGDETETGWSPRLSFVFDRQSMLITEARKYDEGRLATETVIENTFRDGYYYPIRQIVKTFTDDGQWETKRVTLFQNVELNTRVGEAPSMETIFFDGKRKKILHREADGNAQEMAISSGKLAPVFEIGN